MNIGFTSGEFDIIDISNAVKIATENKVNSIELSCLRMSELLLALEKIPLMDLSGFEHVSFHSPSKVSDEEEDFVFIEMKRLIDTYNWNIVVHPYMMRKLDLWRTLGDKICVENMDKRNNRGVMSKTCTELQNIFNELPDAGFCLDMGHAKQVDPTMEEMNKMLKIFGHKLREIHVSEINDIGHHCELNIRTFKALRQMNQWVLPIDLKTIPHIIEAPRNNKMAIDVVNNVKCSILGLKTED